MGETAAEEREEVRGTRVLRYLGNREKPEPEVYDPVERIVKGLEPISSGMIGGLTKIALDILAPKIQNVLFSDFEKNEGASLYTPKNPVDALLSPLFHYMTTPIPSFFYKEEREEKPAPVEPEFEVNLTEALVGWKSWGWNSGRKELTSAFHQPWEPEVAAKAFCPNPIRGHGFPGLRKQQLRCPEVPAFQHSCGIYAVDNVEDVQDGYILGEVYGWGRYVRGEQGWRAQFAYPKCFHLREGQALLIEHLKQYHVPIFVKQEVRMYSPEEDGYDEYRPNEAPRDSGASEESASSEARDSFEDEED